ncbi:MAG: flagellar motor stator protein MotA [Alphaproteobacteria bacterium]
MFVIVGLLIVIGCVLGGYLGAGGKFGILIQPLELVIIGGSALGAFVAGNPKVVVTRAFSAFGALLKGSRYGKESYLELMSLLFVIFKLLRTKGPLALEPHIEKPEESSIFQQFPIFHKDHHAVDFLCDYLRLLTLGTDSPHIMEDLMNEEIETHHLEQQQITKAVQNVADGLPALGIVAAVLGVIKTMTHISEPPEVLGGLIAMALVGTFLGVFMAYGFVAPTANALKSTYEAEGRYLACIKAGLLAHMHGYAPAVAVEFARKALLSNVRPSFLEVEQTCSELPPISA